MAVGGIITGGLNYSPSLLVTAGYFLGVAVVATGVTLSGPSSGAAGVASTPFTVGVTPVGGTISGTLTVTPSDGGGGGSFSPASVNLTTGAPTATFTYTPSTAGAKSISLTNSGGLTNPSAAAYTATGTTPTGALPIMLGVTLTGDLVIFS